MYRYVVTEMSPDRNGPDQNGQTESARSKSPVPSARPQFRTWGAKLACCPGRNLTSLRPGYQILFHVRRYKFAQSNPPGTLPPFKKNFKTYVRPMQTIFTFWVAQNAQNDLFTKKRQNVLRMVMIFWERSTQVWHKMFSKSHPTL